MTTHHLVTHLQDLRTDIFTETNSHERGLAPVGVRTPIPSAGFLALALMTDIHRKIQKKVLQKDPLQFEYERPCEAWMRISRCFHPALQRQWCNHASSALYAFLNDGEKYYFSFTVMLHAWTCRSQDTYFQNQYQMQEHIIKWHYRWWRQLRSMHLMTAIFIGCLLMDRSKSSEWCGIYCTTDICIDRDVASPLQLCDEFFVSSIRRPPFRRDSPSVPKCQLLFVHTSYITL